MNLAEIYVSLPPDVATQLEELLNVIQLPKDPSKDEVLEASRLLVVKLRSPLFAAYQEDAEDKKVSALLDQLPEAIADQLF